MPHVIDAERLRRDATLRSAHIVPSVRRPLAWIVAACISITAAGCSESPTQPPAKKSTTTERSSAATQPSQTQSARNEAKEPDTHPSDELPRSRYDSKPPYPVELHVRDPKEPQPGWLRILKLADAEQPAEARGSFPEQNLMVVDTDNVQQLDVHIGHLPLAEKKRIILRIDGLGIELIRGNREFITLERRPTGAWVKIGER